MTDVQDKAAPAQEQSDKAYAAPVGALIGLLVSSSLVSHAKSLHQSTTTYVDLTYVLLAMAVSTIVGLVAGICLGAMAFVA